VSLWVATYLMQRFVSIWKIDTLEQITIY